LLWASAMVAVAAIQRALGLAVLCVLLLTTA
jgi:hypothetical protein